MKFPFVRLCLLVFSEKPFVQNPFAALSAARRLHFQPPLYKTKAAPNWGSTKYKNKKVLQLQTHYMMADPKTEEILAPLRAAVKEQVSHLIGVFLLLISNHMLQLPG